MRALARWGIAPLLAAPFGAWALGLGDIELQSALNQPFQAQIGLVATQDELQGLKIALATPEMFTSRGIDRPAFLTRLDFRVATNAAGRSVVQVSSRESVAEPFVTLLVEATWSRGRQLREYTVLLDPPVLLPGPAVNAPVQPAQTRPATPNVPGGAINRPSPPAQAPATRAPAPASSTPPRAQPAPQPAEPAPAPRSNDAPRVTPTSAPGGSYGPVQRAETLWAIADRFRPDGVSMNQMMVAMFRANPQAFSGNMNVLRAGATLRLPESADFQELGTIVANSEVQRQTDEWLSRSPQQRTLRLLPPSESAAQSPAPAPQAAPSRTPAVAPAPAPASPAAPPNAVANNAATEESRRLLEVRNEELRNLQNQAVNPPAAPAPATPPGAQAPAAGVDLEPEQLFTDETPGETPTPEAAAPEAVPPPAAPPVRAPQSPSLVAQILGWLSSPVLLIGVGVAAALIVALLYVRRRRQEPEDVTGRWEALESEVEDEEAREATERMRRQIPEESIVVEETARPSRRGDSEPEAGPEPRRASPRAGGRAAASAATVDETLSSQTVINLDQADPVAEADFHMAYGLYDQAAELVQKALEAAPNRRDLKLKLLEVYFVWGNKDAFLNAAQSLRKEIGQKPDSDWDKVVIMGKQICPDERLFAEAASAGGHVDVDLQAGDSPLDLAFDEVSSAGIDLDLGFADADGDLDLETSGTRELKGPPKLAASKKSGRPEIDSSLDIGERTAAGLEAAFFELGDADKDDAGLTTPDIADSLAATQESPTIESPRSGRDWASDAGESPTAEFSVDAPTVETPTIESPGPDSPTMETPTVETPFRRTEPPTVEQPAFNVSDLTAEIDLDDLGLDVKDIEGLPQDLGDLPTAGDGDTREQPALRASDDLLSATGVTQVLRSGIVDDDDDLEQRKTSVLHDEDATMLAPGFGDDNTLTGTEVLDGRFEFDGESGDTSLVKSLKNEDNLDLNLDDLSAALHGADTVEQPRSSSFSNDIFGGGSTPLDMEIGDDMVDTDDPTGTEEVNPLDPQTMTEVGTKLDLARAYIDMGDPEGARSILEEVLDEGDPSQRREAQSLIDVLSA